MAPAKFCFCDEMFGFKVELVLVVRTNICAVFWGFTTFLDESHAQVSVGGSLLG